MKTAKTRNVILALSLGCLMLLGSCSSEGSSSSSGQSGSGDSEAAATEAWYVQYKGNEVSDGQSLTAYVSDAAAMLVSYNIDGEQVSDISYTSSNESVLAVDATTGYLTANAAGTASITAYNDYDSQTYNFTVYETEAANGTYNYATASYEEKAEILGELEKYAVDNYLTGLTLFSDGGYVCYNSDRYAPLPTNYVSGYGWGTKKEGVLLSELSGARGGRPTYYQSGMTTLYEHANAMDGETSTVSDFASYFATTYWDTRLNATNDRYEWYSSLALDDRPIAIDEDGNETEADFNTRWRVHVRTGEDAPVYRTASSVEAVAAYDGQKVALEDYLTPFKFMLTQYNGQYRGSELTDGSYGFAGAANYYNATAANDETGYPSTDAIWDDDLWDMYMGGDDGVLADGSRGNIITGKDDAGDYIEFNFLYECTQFFAMYYLTSTIFSPLPQSFIEYWGADKLGKTPTNYSPVDTMLSTGPYYIDEYSTTKITVTRNDQFYEYIDGQNGDFILNDGHTARTVYQIPGFQFSLIDSSLLESAFTAGEIDAYSPTLAYLNESYNTASGSKGSINWRRYQTEGEANFKLNVNSQTQEQWDERFGVNGTVTAHVEADRYECKPYLSDHDFLDFMSFSLDRQTICESRGKQPTQDYFSDNYLIDPEEGISYNDTDAHKAVLANRYNSTYGYNVSAAKASLLKAFTNEGGLEDLAADGELEGSGTSSDPWLVTIDMLWMDPEDPDDYGDVFDGLYNVFAQVSSEYYGGAYAFNVNQIAGSGDWMAVYYAMMEGSFDLGFGSISGDELDPLMFMYVLRSDNYTGMTLNWGADTNELADSIVYDGLTWSFDALWTAGTTGATVVNGVMPVSSDSDDTEE